MPTLTEAEEKQFESLGLMAARCELDAEDAFLSDRQRAQYLARADRLREWQQVILADPEPIVQRTADAILAEIDSRPEGFRSIFTIWKDTLKGDL